MEITFGETEQLTCYLCKGHKAVRLPSCGGLYNLKRESIGMDCPICKGTGHYSIMESRWYNHEDTKVFILHKYNSIITELKDKFDTGKWYRIIPIYEQYLSLEDIERIKEQNNDNTEYINIPTL